MELTSPKSVIIVPQDLAFSVAFFRLSEFGLLIQNTQLSDLKGASIKPVF